MYSEIRAVKQSNSTCYRFFVSRPNGNIYWITSNDERTLSMIRHVIQENVGAYPKRSECFLGKMLGKIQSDSEYNKICYCFSISYSNGDTCWIASDDEPSLIMIRKIILENFSLLATLYELFQKNEKRDIIEKAAVKYISSLKPALCFSAISTAQQFYTLHKAFLFNSPEMFISICDYYLKGKLDFDIPCIEELFSYSEKILDIEENLFRAKHWECLAILRIMVETGLRLGEVLMISEEERNKDSFHVSRKIWPERPQFNWSGATKALVNKIAPKGDYIFSRSIEAYGRMLHQATSIDPNFCFHSIRKYYLLREYCLKTCGFIK